MSSCQTQRLIAEALQAVIVFNFISKNIFLKELAYIKLRFRSLKATVLIIHVYAGVYCIEDLKVNKREVPMRTRGAMDVL